LTTLGATTGVVTNFSSGNVLATSLGATTATATNFSSGNAVISGGSANGLTTLAATTATATNFSSGNAVISGGSANGLTTLGATTGVVTNFSSGNAVISGGSVNGTPVGATSASTGAFTTLTNSGVHTSNGNLVAASGTNSTSPTTGAVVISANGGLGVTGNAFFANSVVINSTQTAGQDFQVRGKTDTTLIWGRPNATYDSVIVGGSATSSTAIGGAKLVINSTDTIMLPVGSNAQRPTASGTGTDTAGMFRYSNASNAIEWYNGTSWASASTSFTVIVSNPFNGDGTTTGFTLTQAATTASVVVSINGVVQIPTTAYSVSGTTLTFTEAPAVGDVIDCRILTTTATVSSLQSATGKAQVTADDTAGLTFISGTGALPVFNVPLGGGLVSLDANVSIASAGTPTTIDSFSTTAYRSAKYIVQVTNGTNFQTQEALVVHNGTTPQINSYGLVQTNGNLGILSASISGSTVSVQFTAANATNTVRISREYLQL
jgi:hypothetical protein